MTILAKTLHGSRLYGLDHPTSDWDYKSVHAPSIQDCVLLRATRNISSKDTTGPVKIENESFALQEFVELAARGEDVVTTMLHAPDSAILIDSPTFQTLRRERARFYTKSMSNMLNYCVGMAAKYTLRSDRLNTVETVIKVVEQMAKDGVAKLGQAWELLPDLPHTTKGENPLDRNADKRVYTVVGKGLPAPIAPMYALDILTKARDSYGERVRNAKAIDGKDLKAIYTSFRVGYQLRQLFTTGTFSFPLPESQFLRAVKENQLNYVDDSLDIRLNDLISEVEELAAKSAFPEKVDQSWCDQLILNAYSLS